jgi:hypothetical protein
VGLGSPLILQSPQHLRTHEKLLSTLKDKLDSFLSHRRGKERLFPV